MVTISTTTSTVTKDGLTTVVTSAKRHIATTTGLQTFSEMNEVTTAAFVVTFEEVCRSALRTLTRTWEADALTSG